MPLPLVPVMDVPMIRSMHCCCCCCCCSLWRGKRGKSRGGSGGRTGQLGTGVGLRRRDYVLVGRIGALLGRGEGEGWQQQRRRSGGRPSPSWLLLGVLQFRFCSSAAKKWPHCLAFLLFDFSPPFMTSLFSSYFDDLGLSVTHFRRHISRNPDRIARLPLAAPCSAIAKFTMHALASSQLSHPMAATC